VGEIELLLHSFQQHHPQSSSVSSSSSVPSLLASPDPSSSDTGVSSSSLHPSSSSVSPSFEQTATIALQRSLAQAAAHAAALKSAVRELRVFPEFSGRVKAAELLEKRVSAVARNLLCKAFRLSDPGGLQISVEVFMVLDRRMQLQEEFKRFLATHLRPQWRALKELSPPIGCGVFHLVLSLLLLCSFLSPKRASLLRLFAEEIAHQTAEMSTSVHHHSPHAGVSTPRDMSWKAVGGVEGREEDEVTLGATDSTAPPRSRHPLQVSPPQHSRSRQTKRRGGEAKCREEAWSDVLLSCLKVGSEIPNDSVTDYLQTSLRQMISSPPSSSSFLDDAKETEKIIGMGREEGGAQRHPPKANSYRRGVDGRQGGDEEMTGLLPHGDGRKSVDHESVLQTCEGLLQTYETFQTLLCATPLVAESEAQVPQLWKKMSSSCLVFPPLLLRVYNEALCKSLHAILLEESPAVVPFDKRQAPSQVVIELEDRLSRTLQRLERLLPNFPTTSQAVLAPCVLASADAATASFFSSFSPVIQTFTHTIRSKARAALESRGEGLGDPFLTCGVALSPGEEGRDGEGARRRKGLGPRGEAMEGGHSMESFLSPGLLPLDMALLSTCMQQFLLLIGLHRKLDQACTAVFKRAGAAYHRGTRFNSYLRIYVKQHPGLLVYPSPSLISLSEDVLSSSSYLFTSHTKPHSSSSASSSSSSSSFTPHSLSSQAYTQSSSSPLYPVSVSPPLSLIFPRSRRAYLNLLHSAKSLVILTCSEPLSLFLQRYYPSMLQDRFRQSTQDLLQGSGGESKERESLYSNKMTNGPSRKLGEREVEEEEEDLLPSGVMTTVGEFILHLLPHLDVSGTRMNHEEEYREYRLSSTAGGGEKEEGTGRSGAPNGSDGEKKNDLLQRSSLAELEAETSPSSLMAGVLFSLAACFCRILLLLEDSSSSSLRLNNNTSSLSGGGGRAHKFQSKPSSLSSQLPMSQKKKTGASSSSSSSSSRGGFLRSVEVVRQLYSDAKYLTSLCRSLGFDPIADALTLAECSWRSHSLSSQAKEVDRETQNKTGEKKIEDGKRKDEKERERPLQGGQTCEEGEEGRREKKRRDEKKEEKEGKEDRLGENKESLSVGEEHGSLIEEGEERGRRHKKEEENDLDRLTSSYRRPSWMIGFLFLALEEKLGKKEKEEDEALFDSLFMQDEEEEESEEKEKEEREKRSHGDEIERQDLLNEVPRNERSHLEKEEDLREIEKNEENAFSFSALKSTITGSSRRKLFFKRFHSSMMRMITIKKEDFSHTSFPTSSALITQQDERIDAILQSVRTAALDALQNDNSKQGESRFSRVDSRENGDFSRSKNISEPFPGEEEEESPFSKGEENLLLVWSLLYGLGVYGNDSDA
ncbi:hypothetical protein CSUI_002691, partial [Cystoisospora suis]